MHKVCFVDDEQNIRRLVAYDLKQAGYDYTLCENGKEAFQKSRETPFDIFIVDWMMPEMDGIELVRKLRAEGNRALIIMLTAKSEEEDLIDAFDAGVDDYLTKPFSSRELLVRMKAHMNRLTHDQGSMINLNGLTINQIKREVRYDQKLIDLTKMEFELLQYFAKHIDSVLSRDQILNEIWGFDYDGDTRIVDVHVFKLRTKLEQTSLEIKSSRGVGYILELKHDQ